MASRPIVPQQAGGDVVVGGEKQKKMVGEAGRNRRALNDIGNLAAARAPEGKIQISRPITRSFGAQLVANAQAAATNNLKKSDLGATNGDQQQLAVAKKAVAVAATKPVLKKVAIKPEPHEVILISPDTDDKENQKRNSSNNKSTGPTRKKKVLTTTSVLTARSKAACGVGHSKPKEPVIDIDAEDVDNELAVVEYIEDIHKFYKLAENETMPHDYMGLQPELNEKMRAILVDWLIEVHNRFDLMPETLYLTINLIDRFLCLKMVPRRELQLLGIGAMLIASKYEEIWAPEVNDFVAISDRVYSNEQILKMEKTILGKLEWYLTVPTPYVFLTRFIKASIPDDEIENMVYFLAELALMNYSTIAYCPSMIAASAVYVARSTLKRSPAWTETLKVHTGFTEPQLRGCAKLLALLHSAAKDSKLQVVYRKYTKAERCAVACCSPPQSLLASSPPSS